MPQVPARRAVIGLLMGLALAGCRPPVHPPMPCPLRARAEGPALAAASTMPPEVWFDLLAPDHAKASDPWAELHECSGAALTSGPPRESKILPATPPGAAALSFAAAPGGDLLVWARVIHFDDGDALGPIALIHRHEEHLEVTAIGSLRAPATAAALRLESPIDGPPLVIAEGDRCTRGDLCQREAELLPLLGHRFTPIGLRGPDGGMGPARIVLEEEAREDLAGAWVREIAVQRRLVFADAHLRVQEVTRIRECPAGLSQACEDQVAVHREAAIGFEDDALALIPGG